MTQTKIGMCKICMAYCPVEVTIENGRAVKAVGDRQSPLYGGHACPKGRALPEAHNHPERLLHSQKRQPDGSYAPIATSQAIEEIAAKLEQIIEQYGPESVALIPGSGSITNPIGVMIAVAFLKALGSGINRFFSLQTIDQPGKVIAQALHGRWIAGPQPFHTSDTWVLVGTNPVISKMGLGQNPGQVIRQSVKAGMKLIVIDPRKTESAKHACLHIQPKPGQDVALLAGLLHIILNEKLYDQAFVGQHTRGIDELAQAVKGFTPEYVANIAGVEPDQLHQAARTFANARSGCLVTGTGPHFALHGTLVEYLALCINTVCGRWVRAGERDGTPHVLLPPYQPKAQPMAPYQPWDESQPGRLHGLPKSILSSAAGTLADEILTPGKGQIRALFCAGGNPMVSLPDQERTFKAFQSLDLLVSMNIEFSNTSRMADYVIPDRMGFETPALTLFTEGSKYQGLWTQSFEWPYAMYAPALIDPPENSDVIEMWQFFHALAQRMGKQLVTGTGGAGVGEHWDCKPRVVTLDMSKQPTTEEMYELLCADSRVALDEVKKHPHGKLFDELDFQVAERDPDCDAYLQLADDHMMAELKTIYDQGGDVSNLPDENYPLLFITRRMNEFYNSIGRSNPSLGGKIGYNPAYLNPADLEKYGLKSGEKITIRSRYGEIVGVAQGDRQLRPGTLSMAHCFGMNPDEAGAPFEQGACTSRLLSAVDGIDPIFGQPKMSSVAVAIEAMR